MNFVNNFLLQGEHPNPYTLTKALAESIVYSHTNLPVCIIRPSIGKSINILILQALL